MDKTVFETYLGLFVKKEPVVRLQSLNPKGETTGRRDGLVAGWLWIDTADGDHEMPCARPREHHIGLILVLQTRVSNQVES